jgi:hypothetical protein
MDPVSLIVTSIAAGAAAALKPTAELAVKEAFEGLKSLIRQKFGKVDISPVEKRPDSKAKRDSLAEDLAEAGAGEDTELLSSAERLVEVVRTHDAGAAAAVGVDLEDVKAGLIRIRHIVATEGAAGLIAKRLDVAGEIDIEDVRAEGGARIENPQLPN